MPQPSNCYYAQKATPPGVPVPVEALYGGPDNILQWYQVLSSDASPAACTALTNARQTTDAAFKPLTPWVLGKLSANGAAPSAFNISVDSIDNSVLATSAVVWRSIVELETGQCGHQHTRCHNAHSHQFRAMESCMDAEHEQFSAASGLRQHLEQLSGEPWCSVLELPQVHFSQNRQRCARLSKAPSACNYPPGVSPSYV